MTDPIPNSQPGDNEMSAEMERTVAQFFFEVGYGACWADAYIKNGNKPPFPLTDADVERAWAIAPEAHEDHEEWDRYQALADEAENRAAHPVEIEAGQWRGVLEKCWSLLLEINDTGDSDLLEPIADNGMLVIDGIRNQIGVLGAQVDAALASPLSRDTSEIEESANSKAMVRYFHEAADAQERLAEIEAALEPFARAADNLDARDSRKADDDISHGMGIVTAGHLRRARAVLASLRGARS